MYQEMTPVEVSKTNNVWCRQCHEMQDDYQVTDTLPVEEAKKRRGLTENEPLICECCTQRLDVHPVCVYYSPRGLPLVYMGPPALRPVLTVENYPKWYEIFMVMPDGSVQTFDNSNLVIDWADHVPVPNSCMTVASLLEDQPYFWCDTSLDMIVGRYSREIKHPDWGDVLG